MRLDLVPPRVVRFWAFVDTAVIVLALPPTAELFFRLLWGINGLMGFDATIPAFDSLPMFFVNLAGMLIAVWAIARLVHPVGVLCLIDAIGRTAVALLIVWYVVVEGVPPVLGLFVLTEGAGAVMQFRACTKTKTSAAGDDEAVTLH